ncbi:ABC-three component system protein [Tolumonas auensis]|uniref:ABC-three component system protein n=1 Tax=Tolumonas auensis TaxID=43948 RepID=UPI002AA74793|nr:ABC-three component system protein [Tolumonas auensis]
MSPSDSKRKNPTENIGLVLYEEVGGNCPKCTKPLMSKGKNKKTKLYEIAHIYPNSPHPHEITLLENEERLSDDVDSEDNLIALCRDCHKIFDNPRTIEGYQEMVSIKKELQRISKLKRSWFENSIDAELNDIISDLAKYTGEEQFEELSLEAIKVDVKADDTLSGLLKLKIKTNVRYFYSEIKSKFAELDKATPYTSDSIYCQVKAYNVQLKKAGLNQTQMFSALKDWINNRASCKNTEVAEILVSFFVQNCEVYS